MTSPCHDGMAPFWDPLMYVCSILAIIPDSLDFVFLDESQNNPGVLEGVSASLPWKFVTNPCVNVNP